MQSGSMRIMPE